MFFKRITRLVACALCSVLLVLGFGHKPQERVRVVVSGLVTDPVTDPRPVATIVSDVSAQNAEYVKRYHQIRAPEGMVRRGKYERLEPDQQDAYRTVAVVFGEEHVLLKILACESSLRQRRWGDTVRNGNAVGLAQVMTTVHHHDLRRYRLNMENFADNVAFAKYLLDRDGLLPWADSRGCWSTLEFRFQVGA